MTKKTKEDVTNNNVGGIMMILSPAKTLDMNPLPAPQQQDDDDDDDDGIISNNIPDSSTFTIPNCHPEQTTQIVRAMKKRAQSELAKLLSISANLAKTSHQYWKEFEEDFEKRPVEETKPSIYAFSGAAYQGLKALECNRDEIFYLQSNLRIIDGLYGLLKPLDRMQPYRLEMATKNVFAATDNSSKTKKTTKKEEQQPASATVKLNEYWRNAVTDQLRQELRQKQQQPSILLNLASDEYAAAVDPVRLQSDDDDSSSSSSHGVVFVKVVFRNEGRVIAVHAKRARGLMVKFLAQAKATTLDDVRKFDLEGYKLVETETDDTTIVFDRTKKMAQDAAAANKKKQQQQKQQTSAKTKTKTTTKTKRTSSSDDDESKPTDEPTKKRKRTTRK